MKCLRKQAPEEGVLRLEQVTVGRLDQALRRIPDNAGLGSDCVQPGAIKHAHLSAERELCSVLDSIMQSGVLP